MERADIAIIGTGPAGVSAAITAKVRGKTVLLFGSRELSSKLTKAHKIQNYAGCHVGSIQRDPGGRCGDGQTVPERG